MARFDLNQARAARAAINREPLEVLVGDDIFAFTTDPTGIPLEALEAFEEDRIAGFIGALLGPDQWAKLKTHKPTLADLRDFANAWSEAMGFPGGAGESSASGASS